MFCSYCGARLAAVARFCRHCGERLEQGSGAALPEQRPSAATAPAFLDTADDVATLTLEQLVQLPHWPERFVREVSAVVPTLSAEERYRLERACWSHVDAVLHSGTEAGSEVDPEQLERELMDDSLLAVLPWREIGPELLRELRRAAN